MTDTASFARMKAVYNTYVGTVGSDIFVQTLDSRITAVFGGVSGGASLCAGADADFSELDAYFAFLGTAVFCDKTSSDKLSPREKHEFGLFEFTGRGSYCDELKCRISDIYGMLKNGEDGAIELPEFEYWYSDFCARYNHLSAEYAVLEHSAAICGFMTDGISLITGVAVPSENRARGEGRRAVWLLAYKIRKKYRNSRILAAADKDTAGFYIKSGFKNIGSCAVCKY